MSPLGLTWQDRSPTPQQKHKGKTTRHKRLQPTEAEPPPGQGKLRGSAEDLLRSSLGDNWGISGYISSHRESKSPLEISLGKNSTRSHQEHQNAMTGTVVEICNSPITPSHLLNKPSVLSKGLSSYFAAPKWLQYSGTLSFKIQNFQSFQYHILLVSWRQWICSDKQKHWPLPFSVF